MPLSGSAPAGISRELAAERVRQISDLRYHLRYSIDADSAAAPGQEELRFKLKTPAPLLLDFREGSVTTLAVNGRSLKIQSQNGHILLPATSLRAGENALIVHFKAPVAAAGKALTRYKDQDDGATYIYTLFVPMDASMAFPCFDQPDLKGRFKLELTAPAEWTAISNANELRSEAAGAKTKTHFFAETPPISTYLFAFAAGPFDSVHPAAGMPNVYVRQSQINRAKPEAAQIQEITAQGMKFLATYFAQPFPFPKYDLVLIPGFPYGGMEHAGATFLNEDGMLFRRSPTETDRFRRGTTLLHELTHQWFGDFTTMRWFDDLWLKEGFAQYMAFRTMAALAPQQHVWKRFYEQIKPAAYAIDVTKGTTPIYQDIRNLADAKSAYGAIVYSKAPGLLRQLAYILGDDAFRDGLRIYLREHAYGNAEWTDLVHAFERSSGRNLAAWAAAWIHHRGMPAVDVEWSCDAEHRLRMLELRQRDVLDEGGLWPLASEVLLGYPDAAPTRLRAQLTGASTVVAEAAGKTCPAYVFANDEDYAYGLFLLDDRSRNYIINSVESVSDLFLRTLLWGALWDGVRFTQLAPSDYLSAILRHMPAETDEALVQSLGARSIAALHHYISARRLREMAPRFESTAIDHMLHSPQEGLRIMWFRGLVGLASTPVGLNELEGLLDGQISIPGVQLRSLDRWAMVSALIAEGDPNAKEIYEAEQKRDQTGEGRKYSYVAGAAKPEAAAKKWYFDDYLQNTAREEDWVEASLPAFNEWNESELTIPYLRPAMDALQQIKQQRKIFFVLAWVGAFIDGQQSAEADRQVHDWLTGAQLDPDLRLKVLQVLDGLDRTVRIRQKYP